MQWHRSRMYCAAMLPRLILMIYGLYQDTYMSIRYTDVDYDVYTDAARYVIEDHQSPYKRTTYRYTPLLAYALIPNILIHPVCGKVFFALCDIIAGHLIWNILEMRGVSSKHATRYVCLWLFHPLAINISTRGNADVIAVVLVLCTLYLYMRKCQTLAAIAYGLAVHFKIYPIVYALALIVCMDSNYIRSPKPVIKLQHGIWKPLAEFITWERVRFGLVSGSTFLILILVFCTIYGYEFLYETYLYHLTRTDHRHNFSIYFYTLYLSYGASHGMGMGLLSFLPQLSVLIHASLRYGRDLCFAMFALTYLFVMFNKVCTAQYFLWYSAFLPLILPSTLMRLRWKGLVLIVLWLAAELHWLYWAYNLEMLGKNTFTQIWLASIAFFAVNVVILITIISHHQTTPLFHAQSVQKIHHLKKNE